MDINQFASTAQEAITVRRVFAEPYEMDGQTVIPAARVSGGGGAGTGQETGKQGDGGGFGVHASPAGAFVIREGDVRWVPAVDPHRVIAAVAAVVIAVVVARGWVQVRAIRAGQHIAG